MQYNAIEWPKILQIHVGALNMKPVTWSSTLILCYLAKPKRTMKQCSFSIHCKFSVQKTEATSAVRDKLDINNVQASASQKWKENILGVWTHI